MMIKELKIGIIGVAKTIVNEQNTAKAMKSGALDVLCYAVYVCFNGRSFLQLH